MHIKMCVKEFLQETHIKKINKCFMNKNKRNNIKENTLKTQTKLSFKNYCTRKRKHIFRLNFLKCK